MKNCTACHQPIAQNVKFCPECGAKQEDEEVQEIKEVVEVEEHQPVENLHQGEETNVAPTGKKRFPVIYIILCLLSFVGPLHVIAITVFYLFFGTLFNSTTTEITILTIIWSIVSIGSFIGTILLMRRLKKGLVLYTINQAIYIVVAIYLAILAFGNTKNQGLGEAIIVLLVVPAIAFLAVFWFSKLRKYLR